MLRSREAREPPAGASREGDGNRGLGQWNVPLGRGPGAHSAWEPAWLGVCSLAGTCAGCSGSAGELGLLALRTSASPFASEPVA